MENFRPQAKMGEAANSSVLHVTHFVTGDAILSNPLTLEDTTVCLASRFYLMAIPLDVLKETDATITMSGSIGIPGVSSSVNNTTNSQTSRPVMNKASMLQHLARPWTLVTQCLLHALNGYSDP